MWMSHEKPLRMDLCVRSDSMLRVTLAILSMICSSLSDRLEIQGHIIFAMFLKSSSNSSSSSKPQVFMNMPQRNHTIFYISIMIKKILSLSIPHNNPTEFIIGNR